MVDKDLRIFIGPVEIANINAILAGALRERGMRVTAVNCITSPFFGGMKYDKVLDFRGLNRLQRIFRLFEYCRYMLKFFLQHNTFIFLFGISLLPCNLDLPILKLFRKKTVMWFLGSDVRHYESVEAQVRKMGIKYRVSEALKEKPAVLKRKLRMIRVVEKYVDHIISFPAISQLLTRDYVGKEMASRIYLPLDVGNIIYKNVPHPRAVVVHAPSNPEIKGTPHVLKAVQQLKGEGYDFEFCLFRNTSNTKVREMLPDADIAIDQLFATGPGMFALESMAAGCAVLGGNVPEFSDYPRELPVIHTDPDNVYRNLKMLLENPELRRELGEKGRRYVEKYHDSRKIATDIIKLITGG